MFLFFARCTIWALVVTALSVFISPARAESEIELTVRSTQYLGAKVASDRHHCWLTNSDGRYDFIDLSEVTAFRKTGQEFRATTAAAMADKLKKSLGRDYEVQVRRDFVVAAPIGSAKSYLEVVTQVENQFTSYFAMRQWTLEKGRFPLVILVRASREEFVLDCQEHGLPDAKEIKGFYHPQINRVFMYDQAQTAKTVKASTRSKKIDEEVADPLGTMKTLVHETIHLLAFNTGLHNRIGHNPRWVTEGLATLLENGALDSKNRKSNQDRINLDRLQAFQEFRAKTRNHTIIDLITADEQMYLEAPVEFYAEAWALTFYLSEARRVDYVKYLKKISSRESLGDDYSAEERVADFQEIFGKDLRWIDTQFVRYIDTLKVDRPAPVEKPDPDIELIESYYGPTKKIR